MSRQSVVAIMDVEATEPLGLLKTVVERAAVKMERLSGGLDVSSKVEEGLKRRNDGFVACIEETEQPRVDSGLLGLFCRELSEGSEHAELRPADHIARRRDRTGHFDGKACLAIGGHGLSEMFLWIADRGHRSDWLC
jgi:hypothetical protein